MIRNNNLEPKLTNFLRALPFALTALSPYAVAEMNPDVNKYVGEKIERQNLFHVHYDSVKNEFLITPWSEQFDSLGRDEAQNSTEAETSAKLMQIFNGLNIDKISEQEKLVLNYLKGNSKNSKLVSIDSLFHEIRNDVIIGWGYHPNGNENFIPNLIGKGGHIQIFNYDQLKNPKMVPFKIPYGVAAESFERHLRSLENRTNGEKTIIIKPEDDNKFLEAIFGYDGRHAEIGIGRVYNNSSVGLMGIFALPNEKKINDFYIAARFNSGAYVTTDRDIDKKSSGVGISLYGSRDIEFNVHELVNDFLLNNILNPKIKVTFDASLGLEWEREKLKGEIKRKMYDDDNIQRDSDLEKINGSSYHKATGTGSIGARVDIGGGLKIGPVLNYYNSHGPKIGIRGSFKF